MKKKILWLTETAAMLALLVVLQTLTKPMGQMVTGSCVNAVLAVTVLTVGLSGGLTVAVLSPILAYSLGIAPQILVVPAIMLGNAVFVTALACIAGGDSRQQLRQWLAWVVAAVAKFVTMYAVVVWVICGVLSQSLIKSGALKQPAVAVLTGQFSWPQLVTALIGGGVALLMVPVLRKAIRK